MALKAHFFKFNWSWLSCCITVFPCLESKRNTAKTHWFPYRLNTSAICTHQVFIGEIKAYIHHLFCFNTQHKYINLFFIKILRSLEQKRHLQEEVFLCRTVELPFSCFGCGLAIVRTTGIRIRSWILDTKLHWFGGQRHKILHCGQVWSSVLNLACLVFLPYTFLLRSIHGKKMEKWNKVDKKAQDKGFIFILFFPTLNLADWNHCYFWFHIVIWVEWN